MSSDWDEIKSLAADLQKIQLTSTLQKLSERNCIEIVSLLIEKGLIDVIYTVDGKEYITPEHLEKEILDELYVHDGRVNLVELSKILNIDFLKINTIAEKISNENLNIYFILGQLINEDYILRIATEINEKLLQIGQISVSDLTIQFDLPSDFLQENVINKYLGKIIRGRQDPTNPRVFFTQAYISRCKSKIRGALTAITRPKTVSSILQQINIPDKIFHSLIEEISPAGIITSKLTNALYIPHVYAKMQTEWINSFYKQNGFLEYDAISKLGISDPKQFIKKQFSNENMIFLNRCAVGTKITDLTLLSALNECHATKSYLDLTTILPTNFSEDDINELFNLLIKTGKIPNDFINLELTIFTTQFLNNLIQPCKDLAILNAKKSIENGIYQQYIIGKQLSGTNKSLEQDSEHVDSKVERREERRRKAASGKGGGGTQGRETKTKSVKKHQRGGGGSNQQNDSDDDGNDKMSNKANTNLVLITSEEIENLIKQKLEEEGLEHLSSQITKLYSESTNQLALQTAQSLFELTPQTNRRQTHAALQEKLNILLVDVRLYEKGLKLLPSKAQVDLVKYLLKTLCTDICNEIYLYVTNECNLNYKSSSLNVDQRNKIVQECDSEYKTSLTELNKSLTKNSIEEFLIAAENSLKCCGMIIKKIDKKKDRLLVQQHKDKLLQQINDNYSIDDPALILHLTVLILFTAITGNIIHASGRFVSQLLEFLKSNLSDEQNSLLKEFHDLVLKFLNTANETDEKKIILDKLNELKKDILDVVKNYEKSSNNIKTE